MPPNTSNYSNIETAVDALCNKLSHFDHDAVVLTYDNSKQTVYWNGTKLGRAFVFQSSNVVKHFIDFCSVSQRSKAVVTRMEAQNGDLGDTSPDFQNEVLSDCCSEVIPLQNSSKSTNINIQSNSNTQDSINIIKDIVECETNPTLSDDGVGTVDIGSERYDGVNASDDSSSINVPATVGHCCSLDGTYTGGPDFMKSLLSEKRICVQQSSLDTVLLPGNDQIDQAGQMKSQPSGKDPDTSDRKNRDTGVLTRSKINMTLIKRNKKQTKIVQDNEVTDSLMYPCQACNRSFKLKSSLMRHMFMHGDKKLNCSEIVKNSAKKIHLHTHDAVHDGLLICEICSQTFLSEKEKSRHMKKQHNTQKCVNILNSMGNKKNETVFMPLSREYICAVCNIGFPRKASLKRHLCSHGKVKGFRCYVCNQSFWSELELENHAKDHNITLTFTCPFCQEIFTSSFELKNHKESCESNKKYVCQICSVVFVSKEHLQSHAKIHESGSENNITVSEYESKIKEGLYDVPRDKNGKKSETPYNDVSSERVRCLENVGASNVVEVSSVGLYTIEEISCRKADIMKSPLKKFPSSVDCLVKKDKYVEGESSNSITDIQNIENEVLGISIPITLNEDRGTSGKSLPKLSCGICDKRFRVPMALYKHKLQHDEAGKFPCRFCHFVGKNWPSLRRHSNIHKENNPYKCSICEKPCSNKTALQQHMYKHTKEKPHMCETCGKCYSSAQMLRIHSRHHTGERPYSCQFCGKGFFSANVLSNHERIHKNELNFQCEICGAKFNHPANLYLHRRIHSDDRSYVCQKCNKAFKAQKHLTSHYISFHLTREELPNFKYKVVECDLCGKFFSQNKDLITHKRTHTKEKPFVCSFCDKSFANKYNLRSHTKIHTNERSHTCQVCGKGFIVNRDLQKHVKIHSKQKIQEYESTVVTLVDKMKDKISEEVETYMHTFQQNLQNLNFF